MLDQVRDRTEPYAPLSDELEQALGLYMASKATMPEVVADMHTRITQVRFIALLGHI